MALMVVITICGWLGMLGGSAEMAGVAIMGTGVLIMYWLRETSFNNYNPPKGIDHEKMNRDLRNGASIGNVKNNTLAGKYDKK